MPAILQSLPQRIGDVVNRWAERSPDRKALVESSGYWTYQTLDDAVSKTQTWLSDLAVRPGDRVMIVCENCRALVAILLALTNLDAWPVLVNARLSAREVDEIRDHCGARRIIYTTSVSPQATQHARRHSAAIENISELGQLGISPVNRDAKPEPIDRNITHRVAALIYTSGTTGLPKGVMLTHRNLLFVAAVSADIRNLTLDDRLYGVLPISHAVGLSVVLLGALLSGATLYLAPRFDPVAALATMKNDALSVVLGAPAMFSLLLEYTSLKGIKSLQLPALRIISSSSAPLQPALKSQTESLFGLTLHNGYGVTECSPNIAQTRLEAPSEDVSVGRIFPGVDVKLVDTEGKSVPEGEIGELRVRGPNIMKGYYRAPEETSAAIDQEGWFNTGDLARLEDGTLFIVGRTREVIVRFGYNVYPAEVEAVINSHPQVVRSAVVGGSAKGVEGGEDVVAYVQLSPGSNLTLSELENYASQYLAPYKRPSHVVLLPDMPLSPTGKVIKHELAKIVERI
ncbi:MAG: class I adenylate-forming enzyme family protein [Terriglobales bacterium]